MLFSRCAESGGAEHDGPPRETFNGSRSMVNRQSYKPIVFCVLCPSDRPQRVQEWHHLRELHYGGAEDGQTIPLCGTHHTKVHAVADRLHKAGGLSALQHSGLPPMWISVLMPLLDQRRLFLEGGGVAPDARRRITASLTEEEQDMAHYVKKCMKAPSLEQMIKVLIRRAYDNIKRNGG